MSSRSMQHISRAWRRHWALQMASVTVMTVVLMLLNFMFLGFSTFNQLVSQWGEGLEMIVYLHDGDSKLDEIKLRLQNSGDFDKVTYVSKNDATKKFLTALGPESLELLKDPKWKSPIPASFELRLAEKIPVANRVHAMENWASELRASSVVEDVFYGQGWIENFSRFLSSGRGLVVLIWVMSLSVGLLIVSNCIRLSFMQRRDEIEILELVGATPRFIRAPYLLEGISLGLMASMISLGLSFALHSLILSWLSRSLGFWVAFTQVPALEPWYIVVNLATASVFGLLGAWNCVRKLNTGWAAAS